MIQLFAKAGNHNKFENFTSDAQVKRAFSMNGVAYDQLVDACRDPNQSVPIFENLLGSTWTAMGSSIARVDLSTGEEITKVEGPGTFTPEAYWATDELANQALERAISGASYAEFLSSVVHGVAAIEGFLSERVVEWNRKHPDQQLVDSKTQKISLDDKIDLWLPMLTNGKRLDKSGIRWASFRRLRAIRDDVAIHPKAPGHGIRFQGLVEPTNLFSTGIAGLLIDIHLVLGHRIPRMIIRDAYAPEIVLVENHDELR